MSKSYKSQAEQLLLGPGVRILDVFGNGLVALNKPEGILSHPNEPTDLHRSLLEEPYCIKNECYILEEDNTFFYLLHRLDSATSGIILGSLDLNTAQTVRKLFKQRKVAKTYLALVKGNPQAKPDLWVDRLDRKKTAGKLRVFSGKGTLAKTHVKVMASVNGLSLLELAPITGFTHQLRVQCALRGYPIVGDKTYGDFNFNRSFSKQKGVSRLCLHAWMLMLDLECYGKETSLKLESIMPEFSKFF